MKLAWSVFLALSAAAALTSLLLEFGFELPPTLVPVLHAVDLGVVLIFAGDVVLRFLGAADRREWARRRWMELALLGSVVLLFVTTTFASATAAIRVYVVVAQVYVLASVLLAAIRANERLTARRIRPAFILLGSFVLLIAIGALLLQFPRCQTRPLTFLEVLFTSTSASCVTGLNVIDVGRDLTFRGQAVLLALIQAGGLGLVTLAMFVTVLSRRTLALQQMTLVRELVAVPSMSELGRLLTYTLTITLVAEAAGAALLWQARPDLDGGGRLWWAVFTSVSAFCNAGFTLDSAGLVPYREAPGALVPVMGLIVIGGLGFPVLLDLLRFEVSSLGWVRRARWTPGAHLGPRRRLSLHTRVVLVSAGLLLAVGTVLFAMAEWNHELAGRGPGDRLLTSLFQSVTARTAGFNTVDMASLRLPALLLMMLLMVVGASPASTGGGIKTTTLAVLALTVRAMIRGRERAEAFGRAIPTNVVQAAVTIVVLYGLAAVTTTAVLLSTQPGILFLEAGFESVSALSTVGLSMNLTPRLNETGRMAIIVAMVVGRIGPLAVLWTVLARPPGLRYDYPEEPVVVS